MSYISVPAEKVIKCCEAFIIKSDANKLKRIDEIIGELAKTRGWNFKPLGVAKAREMLENNNGGMGYQIRFDVALYVKSEKREMVERLLLLAKNGDPVMVSDKHAFIFEY
jgi:hypothetical protein